MAQISVLPVTVVLPVRNEAASITSILRCLAEQTSPPAEILFCDGGSSDGTAQIIQAWWRKYGSTRIQLQVLDNPRILPGAGRNLGIAAAQFPWIAFLDGGILPETDWLERLFDAARGQAISAMFGVCDFEAKGLVPRAVCALTYGCGSVHPVIPASLFLKEALSAVGPFREDLLAAEDILWMQRFVSVFGQPPVCSGARVHYRNFPATAAQAMRKWRRAEAHVLRANVRRRRQYVFFCSPPLLLWLLIAVPSLGAALLVTYLGVRGIAMPMRRSAATGWWKESILTLPTTMAMALLLDLARWVGIIDGAFQLCRDAVPKARHEN